MNDFGEDKIRKSNEEAKSQEEVERQLPAISEEEEAAGNSVGTQGGGEGGRVF